MKYTEKVYSGSMGGRLYLDFCGDELVLEPGGSLTFGRCADLVVDDNPYLHRRLGRFVDRGGVWCLEHTARSTPIVVLDSNGPLASTVAPGSALAIVHGEFSVSFSAGRASYELLGGLEDHEWQLDLLGAQGVEGTTTLDWGRVELNDDQRLLLVALCEARLRDPRRTRSAPPANRAAAARLGWSLAKFNRKLDHLCEKLHRAGVPGVHGGVGASAADRRRNLVEHALLSALVDQRDLALLDDLAA